ncbi:alkaline phosphatase [Ectothiorhodospira variabilis]|uniref:alkaline phosphatase n=1 Tax=Ectothiorhodospira variabilis TaxID=505694 RepID=UPI001EFA79F2|nr:alkaline phosphatase [Ectothiorhodospira variabilis]MCG5496962.1 alkaline phosphatase [Ectothiorhodospira variabilis]
MRFRSSTVAVVTTVALVWAMAPAQAGMPKNVIVLVPDGQSQSVVTLGRLYRGEPLALDEIATGMVNTSMTNSVITGSAAAATAFATGYKTSEPHIGMAPRSYDILSNYQLPEGVDWDWFEYRPLATLLEGAQLAGKATGVVATSRISHATPAGYTAHVDARGKENEIMKHMVYQNLDVVFGGGSRHLLPRSMGGSRDDGENLRQVLHDRGYQVIDHADDLHGIHSDRVWGLFASSSMMPELDRRYLRENGHDYDVSLHEQALAEPSLSEMTAKALELLSQERNGFFLMVEGSQIDWAGHSNDVVYHLQDFLEFDDSVRLALDFAKHDGQTMVVVVPDHNTGALALGNWASSGNYTRTSIERVIEPLQGMQVTANFLSAQLPGNPSDGDIRDTVAKYWNIHLSDDDLATIRDEQSIRGLQRAIIKVVNDNHTIFGWTTHGHSGEDVPLWSYGPGAPTGYVDNADIGQIMGKAMRLNLSLTHPSGLNQRLFVDVQEHFPEAVVDDTGATLGEWRLVNGTDVLQRGDDTCQLEGLVVHSPLAGGGEGRTFVPAQAIEIMQRPVMWNRHCGVSQPNNLGQSIRDRVHERLERAFSERGMR